MPALGHDWVLELFVTNRALRRDRIRTVRGVGVIGFVVGVGHSLLSLSLALFPVLFHLPACFVVTTIMNI